jgi:FtsH-binding integral membrane protein
MKLLTTVLIIPYAFAFENKVSFATSVLAENYFNTPPIQKISSYSNTDNISSSSTNVISKFKDIQYDRRTTKDFSTRDSRHGFIRKVYAIFGSQIATTIAITLLIISNTAFSNFLQKNFQILSIVSFILSTGIISALVTQPQLRYKSPVNYILLGLHTLLQSLIVGTFSSLYDPKKVLVGSMHTLMTFLAMTIYSFQPNPKYDLTTIGYTLLSFLTSIIVGSFVNIFLKIPLLDNVFSGLLAIVFAIYIMHDTQKIIGGKHHKFQYSSKEFILAALNLYQDVINFFIEIMLLLEKNNKRKEK